MTTQANTGNVNLDHQDLLLHQGAFDEAEYKREYNKYLDQQEEYDDEFSQ